MEEQTKQQPIPQPETPKKKFYKKWWILFWPVVFFISYILLVLFGGSHDFPISYEALLVTILGGIPLFALIGLIMVIVNRKKSRVILVKNWKFWAWLITFGIIAAYIIYAIIDIFNELKDYY